MFMKKSVLAVLLLLIAAPVWAISNPARQAAQQRGTESPADGVWYVYDRNGALLREEN